MKDKIISALKTVYDPEIPVNIYDLGLVYDIESVECRVEGRDNNANNNLNSQLSNLNSVKIKMTFTSPTCPMMEEIFEQIKSTVGSIDGVSDVKIELVWDPPWDVSKMSDTARLELDLTEQGW